MFTEFSSLSPGLVYVKLGVLCRVMSYRIESYRCDSVGPQNRLVNLQRLHLD